MTLVAKHLALGYQHQIVVPDASLTIARGEITCLIGANGCGKSTLLKALAGVHRPHAGSIFLDDTLLSAWPRKRLARELAFLPQTPIAPDDITLEQLVSHGRFAHQGLLGRISVADIEAIEHALAITGMTEFMHRPFNTLSGGERQRGWIALAIAQQAKLLLLDEPTTYLDIGHQYEVLSLLSELNRQHQLTIVMVLHDINQASQFADRILTMHQGQIIADAPPREAINAAMMQQVFGIDVELQTRHRGNKSYPYLIPTGANW